MKPRELRRKVVINARMRAGASWGDVCLLNMSSRGALAQAPVAPSKGSYIEFRRGSHVIVARVWAEKHRFGVYTQDPISVDSMIADACGKAVKAPKGDAEAAVERRAHSSRRRLNDRHERSRFVGRSMEFLFLAGSGAMLAVVAFSLVQQSVAAPMARINAALTQR